MLDESSLCKREKVLQFNSVERVQGPPAVGKDSLRKDKKHVPLRANQPFVSGHILFKSPAADRPKTPKKHLPIARNPRHVLVTKNQTATTKPNVAARTKDQRLKGADLYVARLGTCHSTSTVTRPSSPILPPLTSPPSPNSSPASLHDELSAFSRTPSPAPLNLNPSISAPPEIRASRPCYRCVSAMHAAGIKRVFWTTAAGTWEGTKVRDLVDALENGGGTPGKDDGGVNGVLVTKHEVLVLKRVMGS